MPLGFGDRSTVDLLLEITGRNDASGAVRRAAQDLRGLAAAKDVTNARSKVENDLERARLDLKRAAEAQALREKAAVEKLTKAEKDRADLATRKYDSIRNKLADYERAQQRVESALSGRRADGKIRSPFTDRWMEEEKVMAQFDRRYGEITNRVHNFQRASEEGALALERAKRGFEDATKAAEDAGKKVDQTAKFWGKLGHGIDQASERLKYFGGGGVGGRILASIITLPLEAAGAFAKLASEGDKFFSRFLGPLGVAAGPVSALLGLVTALAGAFLALPAGIAVAVAAITAFADVIGAGLAVLVGFIPPVTMLVGLLGGLGAAFAYVTTQSIKNASTAQGHADALRTLHAAQLTYNNDLKKQGANDPQTLNALVALHKAQDAYAQSQLGVAINSAHIQDKFKSLVGTLSKDFTPEIISGTKALSGWLTYLDKVAHMPLDKAFASLGGAGVNRLQHNLENIGGRIGPVIQDAIAVAFGSPNLRNKMVHDWNQIMNFLSGPNGALNPVEKWFDAQHFQRTGFRWVHEFEGWIVSSGLLDNIGTLLGNAIFDGIKFGVKAGISFLKSEVGLVSAGGLLAGAVGLSAAKSLIGMAGAGIAGRVAGGAAGLFGGGAGAAEQLALFGGGGALGAAGGGLLGAGALALPALGAWVSTMKRNPFTGSIQVGTGHPWWEFWKGANLQGAVNTQLQQQLQANVGASFTRQQTVQLASMVSGALGLSHQGANFNRSWSLLAGHPLAPNELALLANNMGLRPGIRQFMRLSGGRLPGDAALSAIRQGGRSQAAVATLMAETGKIATPHQIHILTDIPHVALPAIIHLIERLHHMPTKKEIKVAVQGAEQSEKHLEALRKHLTYLEEVKHQTRLTGNTTQVDHQIRGIQQKIDQLTKSRHDVGKGLYLRPSYAAITTNAQAVGKSIDSGIASGIQANAGIANAAATAVAQQIIATMQTAIKAHSPSQEAANKIGVPIVQGITAGMLKAINSAQSSNSTKSVMQTMLQTMLGVFDNFKSQFQQGFGSLFTGPGGTGTNPRTGFATPLATMLGFPGTKIPYGVVAGDLRAQLQTFKKFSHSLNQLQHKGYPLLLIQQIAALGPAAQPEIDALLSADRSEVKQYSKMFRESQKLINGAAMKQSIEQLDIWKHAGKGVAVGILAGLRSAEPQIEEMLAHMISRLLKGGGGHGRSGTHPHTVVNQTIHAHANESLGTTLRRASFHYRNATT